MKIALKNVDWFDYPKTKAHLVMLKKIVEDKKISEKGNPANKEDLSNLRGIVILLTNYIDSQLSYSVPKDLPLEVAYLNYIEAIEEYFSIIDEGDDGAADSLQRASDISSDDIEANDPTCILSTRTRRLLEYSDIFTLSQLNNYSLFELMRINGFGKICLIEVITFLESKETSLKDSFGEVESSKESRNETLESLILPGHILGRLKRNGICDMKSLLSNSLLDLLGLPEISDTSVIVVVQRLKSKGLRLQIENHSTIKRFCQSK